MPPALRRPFARRANHSLGSGGVSTFAARPSGCRTTSSPAPPSSDERCVTIQRAVSGAAPGSARCRPRFRATRSAPRIRGARATGATGRSTTDSARRVPAHRRPPTTATRGGEPRRPPAGATRSTTDPHHRVPIRTGPRPPAPRGDEPRQTQPAPREAPLHRLTRRGPHAHRRRTRDRAPRGGRTMSSPATPSPDQRCAPSQMAVSGAAPGSARSRPRFRGTRPTPRIRGARPPVRPSGATTDPTRRVAARRRPPTTALRGDEPRPP